MSYILPSVTPNRPTRSLDGRSERKGRPVREKRTCTPSITEKGYTMRTSAGATDAVEKNRAVLAHRDARADKEVLTKTKEPRNNMAPRIMETVPADSRAELLSLPAHRDVTYSHMTYSHTTPRG